MPQLLTCHQTGAPHVPTQEQRAAAIAALEFEAYRRRTGAFPEVGSTACRDCRMPHTDLDAAFSAGWQAGLVGMVESDNPYSDEPAGPADSSAWPGDWAGHAFAHSPLGLMRHTPLHLLLGLAPHDPSVDGSWQGGCDGRASSELHSTPAFLYVRRRTSTGRRASCRRLGHRLYDSAQR